VEAAGAAGKVAFIKAKPGATSNGFGTLMQLVGAQTYIGKRVRLSMALKTAAAGRAQVWMRVDGDTSRPLAFDNMDNRPVKGTSDWQEASVVLDVPPKSKLLAYGFFVQGGGKMWVNGQRMEIVGDDVPTTNMALQPPAAPRNLGFNPSAPK
jgi:hypothetical protein